MKLTVEEFKDVVRQVARKLMERAAKAKKDDEEKGEKGRDGYVDEDVMPHGYSEGAKGNLDFSQPLSKTTEEGNLYKRQGNSNMGPWTSEGALRAIVRDVMEEEFKLKPMPNSKVKESAPFNARIETGPAGSVGNTKLEGWKTTKKEGSVWENLAHWYDIPMKESRNCHKPVLVEKMVREEMSRRLMDRKNGGK